MAPNDDRLETLKALSWHRHVEMANLVVLVLGIAAETHPEEVRRALANVFDLEAIAETTRRMMLVVTSAQAAALECRHLLQEVHKDVDVLEQRLDAIAYELERAEKAKPNLRVAK